MKKLLTLVLALAMTLSLAACGGSDTTATDSGSSGDSSSGEPTKMTLILRGGAYGESLEAMLPAFEEEHNVDIEVMLMSFDDLHTGIALDAVNEVGTYDLCMVDGSWMAEFTANGVLANLSEMGYSFDDDIIPATTSICMVDDNIYLAPYYGNVTVTHEAHIPSGQWIEVPVESGRGHVLRLFVDGEHVESLSLGSACIIGDPAVISGDCIVELSGTVHPDGAYGVEVTV